MQTGWPCSLASVKGNHQPVADIQSSLIFFKASLCCSSLQHLHLPWYHLWPGIPHQTDHRGTRATPGAITLSPGLQGGPCWTVDGAPLASHCAFLLQLLRSVAVEENAPVPAAGAGAEGPPQSFVQCQQPLHCRGFQRDRGERKGKAWETELALCARTKRYCWRLRDAV